MAKEEFGHSYTFGTMAIMIFSPVSNSLHHPLLITDMPSKCGVRSKEFFFLKLEYQNGLEIFQPLCTVAFYCRLQPPPPTCLGRRRRRVALPAPDLLGWPAGRSAGWLQGLKPAK